MDGSGMPSAGHFRTTVLAAGLTTRWMLSFFCVHLGGPAEDTQTDTNVISSVQHPLRKYVQFETNIKALILKLN